MSWERTPILWEPIRLLAEQESKLITARHVVSQPLMAVVIIAVTMPAMGDSVKAGITSTLSLGQRGVVVRTDSREIRINDIKDGASNTIMVAEKALHPDRHGQDGGDNEPWVNAGWDECVIRHGAGRNSAGEEYGLTPLYDTDAPTNTVAVVDKGGVSWTNWHPFFGSAHQGGMNACLGRRFGAAHQL